MSTTRMFFVCFFATLLSNACWYHRREIFTTSICFFDNILDTGWDKVCK